MAKLGENRYGKSRVRLSRITRHGDRHDFNEWTVHVLLEGDFETSYTEADNSKVLPTDTMKNTVYFVARGSKAEDHRRVCNGVGRLSADQQSAGLRGPSGRLRRGPGSKWSSMARRMQPLSNWAVRRYKPCAPCATGPRMVHNFRRGWVDDSQNNQVGIHRLHQGQADHAEAGDGPHLWHQSDGELGLCDRRCLILRRYARASLPRC